MKRHSVWAVLLGLILTLAVSGCNKRAGLQVGDRTPEVTLTAFNGSTVKLPHDLKGKVWLVRFWSLDCGFCDKEVLLSLESLYQKYKAQGFVLVAVNVNKFVAGDERLKKFESLTYPMLNDEYGIVAKRFGVIALPTTFVFDEKGILRDKITGEAGMEEFEKLFTTVLYKGGIYDSAY